MDVGMADPDVNRLTLVCPRNCQNQNDILQIFQKLTPPNCPFRPTRIWSRKTKKKKNSCLWCVLYTIVDPQMQYLTGTQARELRTELNKWTPFCGEIVDYEFYTNVGTNEQGWLFVWKNLACTHTPHFCKHDNIHKGELSVVALIFGISGALRKIELCNIKLCDLKDLNSALLVMIPVTKNKIPRSFTITGIFYEIYKKYASLRPKHLANPNERFFINYQKGKCTSQFVGINKFGNMVKQIAKFLNLPNPETYTGHSFRRSSATILVDSGGDLLTLKRHGGWQSSAVAEGYVNDSFNKKMEISNRIVQSVELAPALLSSSSSINTEEESLQAQKNQNMGTPEASNILNLAFTSSSNTVQAEQNQLESELSNVPIKPSLRPGSISKHSSSREFKPTTGSQRSLSVPPKIPNPSPSTSKDMSFLEQHFYIDAGVNLPTNSEPNSLNVVDDDKVNLRKLCNNNKVEKINKRYSSVMSTTCLEKNQERKALNRRSLNITSKESSKIPVSYKNFVKTTEKKIVTNNDENKPNNVDFNNSYAVSSSKSNSLVLESNNNSNRGSLKMTSSQLPVVKRRSVSEIGKPF